MAKLDAQLTLGFMLAPFILGLTFGVLGANAFREPFGFAKFTIGMLLVGFCLFLFAKLSVVRSGTLVSYGASTMAPWPRRAYRAGYAFMIFGAVSTAVLVGAAG